MDKKKSTNIKYSFGNESKMLICIHIHCGQGHVSTFHANTNALLKLAEDEENVHH